ncbi:hypothetical protein P389DRAFT_170363 [Cystobasidium minutum MCA 4210]|uniref:uncharacterized protein n=1 Tax=Cystobasidium minutum MCA 4210 TaxID=1397322 RepID=UPI0034CEC018|eukprot:jgi/Rhomi1/170363/fgenesh1_kg.4_\
MAQTSRISLDTETDLVAYDSSSVLPAAGSGYSFGPPPSVSPSDNMSRRESLDNRLNSSGHSQDMNNMSATSSSSSPGFSNRSRARATSIASKFSHATLPLYSARDPTSSAPSQASTSSNTIQHAQYSGGGRHRNSTNSDDDSQHGEHDDDDDYEDGSDEDDLEMDTLNKNSGGKGGWKMVANTDTPFSSLFSPSSHTHPPGRRSMSDGAAEHHEKLPNGYHQKGLKHSRFERFDKTEITAMAVSLALVTFLTVASLQICFNGK